MSLEYAWEKLYITVRNLASGTGSIQERLADAYISGGYILGLGTQNELPTDLQPSYAAINRTMTRVPAQGDEGDIVATTRQMSDDEAVEVAEQIVDLFNEVAHRVGPG